MDTLREALHIAAQAVAGAQGYLEPDNMKSDDEMFTDISENASKETSSDTSKLRLRQRKAPRKTSSSLSQKSVSTKVVIKRDGGLSKI